jgi:hypothetical protein
MSDFPPLQQPLVPDEELHSAQQTLRRTNHRLPLRFCDMLPECLLPLPPPEVFSAMQMASAPDSNNSVHLSQTIPPARSSPQSTRSLYASTCQLFRTQMNRFGLFHLYNTESPSHHDPEDPSLVKNIHPEPSGMQPSNKPGAENPYYPYPNKSVMRLGNWYWNEGAQKSNESFKQLLHIVGNPAFSPSNVSQTV